MIYNETTKEVYIDKQERIKPESSNNYDTDRPDINLDKTKQEVQRKDQGEQEVRMTEVMKNVELVVDSPGKRKTNSENLKDIEKRERNEGQYDEETTVQKEQDNISEILVNKGMKSKEITGNGKLSVKVNSLSQVKQISNELIIQDNNYHTNLTKLGHEQREQSHPIKAPETGTESKDKEVENQTKKLQREKIITYTTENIKNSKKY